MSWQSIGLSNSHADFGHLRHMHPYVMEAGLASCACLPACLPAPPLPCVL